MGTGGENSSSHQASPVEFSWAPATPAKPSSSNGKLICKNGDEIRLERASIEETGRLLDSSVGTERSFSCWESSLGSKSQDYDINVAGKYNGFPMNNVVMWNSIPCTDLLALADAAVAAKDCCGGGSGSSHLGGSAGGREEERSFCTSFSAGPDIEQYGRPSGSRYLLDLNSPPRTVTEAPSVTGLPSQFTPVTPDQPRSAEKRQVASDNQENERSNHEGQPQLIIEISHDSISTLMSVNQNAEKGLIEETNLSKTPQPKQRRRKHRPKVVIEGETKGSKSSMTPRTDGSSTGKRKYVRKKQVDKSADMTIMEEVNENSDLSTVRENRSSCRRKINFDEDLSCIQQQNLYTGVQSTLQPGQGGKMMVEITRTELPFDKSSSRNDVVENHPAVLVSQGLSPITHNKTEIVHERPTKDSKDTCTRAKCHINFSQDAQDKDASAMASPNESNCSTSACLNKGEEAWGSTQDHLSDIDGMERCSQKVIGVRDDPVEAYLSRFTDYGLPFPVIVKKRRTEKYHGSVKPTTVSSVWSAEAYNRSFSAAPSASKAPETVNGLNDNQHSYGHMLAFSHMENFKRKRTKGLTRMRDSSSFARIIEDNWWPSPKVASGYEASHQSHTCMEALAADFRVSIATKKRTKRNSAVPSYLYHNHQFLTNQTGVYPCSKGKILYDIDALIKQFELLDINSRMSEQHRHALIPYLTRYQEENALVLYQRDGSLVPFEGIYPERRRKPRPKVDLDDETTRVWRLLLENIDSQGVDGTDEEKAKWWEEERRVFRGRADSFIARMHLVQGDRRFSQWKGSIVDSVIGVFLTQNVSDHLSSSAFMSLAARYPVKPKSSNEPLHEEMASISIQEPSHVDLNNIIDWHEEKSDQPARDHGSVTQQDADSCEEREVEKSNKISKSSDTMVGLIDKSVCESPKISEKDLGKYQQSVVDTSHTCILRTVASSTGDRREINDLVSSHDYVDTPPNSEQSSIALTAERLGSCSGEDLIGSKSNILGGATFVELLHKQEPSRSHIIHCQEKSNGSAKNNNLQDESKGTTYSQEQNEGIPHGRNTPSPLLISPKDCELQMAPTSGGPGAEYFALKEESKFFQKTFEDKCTSEQSGLSAESTCQTTVQVIKIKSSQEAPNSCTIFQTERQEILHPGMMADIPNSNITQHACGNNCEVQQVLDTTNFSAEIPEVTESHNSLENSRKTAYRIVESNLNDHGNLQNTVNDMDEGSSKAKRGIYGKAKKMDIEWDSLRKLAQVTYKRERTPDTVDSLDYEAVRCADVNEIADTIKERGMNNMLAERIKDFLNRIVRDHGSIDLEWLRDVPPDKAKEYLLSFRGLGLKSVECVRLLTLHHLAFPVDTNVGRIAVRLGWVPLQPLPESLQLHLLELYPVLESIQKYLWPRLCKLDQKTLYELHYQMITFGKVFCTKSKPNCNSCPMRGECRHFASAFASARFALPAPEEKSMVSATESKTYDPYQTGVIDKRHLTPAPPVRLLQIQSRTENCDSVTEEPATLEPVVEEPATPEPKVDLPTTPESGRIQQETFDIEDFCEDPEEIPTIKLNMEEFTQNLQTYMEKNIELGEGEMSKALVALTLEAASIPAPKLKNVSQLRTEHQVYELPDSHPLLEGLDKREPDDPCSYLLAIWTPGETADSIQPPGRQCSSREPGSLCNEETCFACNSIREANSQTVRGTLLIPCRTAMRGSFPLNGTYFQVNEVFADHDSSLNPIDVPRSWLWNLPRRTVYFGTSIPTIFKGLTTENIQYCFWRGFVCVRGFDQKTRAPRPLMARLHFPASKLKRSRVNTDEN